MLRLRRSILAQVFSSMHRLLSATAVPRISPNPSFAIEDYLVDSCGLTRAQALKASAKLSHLKSPSNPDAVLAFLAGLDLSGSDVAALVARDPEFLRAKVDKTLAPNVCEIIGLGVLSYQVARLVSLAPDRFRLASIVSKLHYYLPLFGSPENLSRALKHGSHLLCPDLERVVKPNAAFLQECGLSDCDIAKLCFNVSLMLATDPKRIRAMLACAEGLGVPRGSGMFRNALKAIAFLSEDKIATKVDNLKKTFRWSDADVSIDVSKAPFLLRWSKESLHLKSDFLISELGLESAYIAHRLVMICYSMEGRLRPRHYVLKFLKENGLQHCKWSYGTVFMVGEKKFTETFIFPHKEATPHLAEDYAAACRGEVPARFIIARTKNLR